MCRRRPRRRWSAALADWFAVTALFRHPLGLPIPHTAIIPRKKDQIGRALAGFVQQNFLNGPVVAERLQAAEIPLRAGRVAAATRSTRPRSRPTSARASGAPRPSCAMTSCARRSSATSTGACTTRPSRRAWPAAIDALCDSGQHQVALTAVLRAVMRFLDENRAVLRERLEQESPDWVPAWVDERVFNRAFAGLQSFLADVIAHDDHALRQGFDRRLRDYAARTAHRPARGGPGRGRQEPAARPARCARLVRHAVDPAEGQPAGRVGRSALAAAAGPGRPDRAGSAGRWRPTTQLRAKVDGWVVNAAHFVLTRYEPEVLGLISATVDRWDAADTGRRLELQVGRDLQFIRLNGTVVGAVVGVLIYSVAPAALIGRGRPTGRATTSTT